MKKAVILCSVFCLLSPAFADTHTSVGDGLWSAAATWNPAAVPADGDTVNIDTSGEDITFDVDQSAFAGLAGLTIAAGASLIASTNAGAYVLKMNADLTNNGTLQAGTSRAVPYPSTCTFNINFSSSAGNILGTGVVNLYCSEPTIKYVTTSEALAVGEGTVLDPIDYTGSDISSDWAVNDYVVISDATVPGTIDIERLQIAALSSTQITLAAGVAATKSSGAKIALLTRNIRIINSTNALGVIYNMGSCTIDAELYGNSTNALYLLQNSNIGGACYGSTYALNFGFSIISDCVMLGSAIGNTYASTQNTLITGCAVGITGSFGINLTSSSLIFQCTAGVSASGVIRSYGELAYCGDGFLRCSGLTLSNIFTACTNDLDGCGTGSSHNTTFGTTEFNNYNSSYRSASDYFESSDHDTVTNAFKAWCRGGIVTSQTASPPTGYAIWYELACESATYPCFRQYQTVVQPGTAIEVEGLIRIADAEDHTAYPPRLQVIDAFADNLVDATQTSLDESQVADPDGSDSSWQTVSVIWANQGDSPRTVLVRMIAKHATGDVDTVWSVADYQDQIATILSVVRPTAGHVSVSNTASTFTLDFGQATADAYKNMTLQVRDADTGFWEERSVTGWTAAKVVTVDTAFSFIPAVDDQARITATSYGGPVDTIAIADSVWDEAIADHTGEATFGGELQQLDPNITILKNYAQEWDPNFTAMLADTNELETDWTNGGRLDLLIDAIKAVTDIMEAVNSTVSVLGDANSFTIANTGDINDVNDAYRGMTVYVKDATTGDWESRLVDNWETGRVITVDSDFTFTPEVGDIVVIWGTSYFPVDVYDGLPMPPEPEVITIDHRVAPTGGTVGAARTLDAEDDDP